jgi:signal transduction histidine kinase
MGGRRLGQLPEPGGAAALLERLYTGAGDPVVRRPRRATAQLAVLAALFAALDLALGLAGPPTTGWAGPYAGVALQLLADASLVLLVRFPRAVGALAVAVTLAMAGSDLLDPGLLVPEASLSPVTAPRSAAVVVLWLVVHVERRTAAAVVLAVAVLAARPWSPSWTATPLGLLSTLGPALVGMYLVARHELVSSLRDRVERAERERHLLAERARAEERRRLAAEMHDVVTHRLSLVVLHAGALGVSSADPGVRRAAHDIRAAGAQALGELRDLVGVLAGDRSDGAPIARAPDRPTEHTAPDPAVLAEEAAAAGTPVVEFDVVGEPAAVSSTVARTAYRVVQEALTNVRKHAPGAEVRILLRYHPDEVRVQVANTAATGPPDPVLAASGSGTGLRGLTERVRLVGGSLSSGPQDGGGFRVDAILPGHVPTSGAPAGKGSAPSTQAPAPPG